MANSPANLVVTSRSATSLALPPAPQLPDSLASSNPADRARGLAEFNRRLSEWVTRANHVLDQAITSIKTTEDPTPSP